MAAHVLRLRAALLLGALRGDGRHIARLVLGLVLLVAATVAGCRAILSLEDVQTEVMIAVSVLGGSAVMLGFALAPLIAGANDPLDPRRFALLGLPSGRLAAVLAIVGAVSVPIAAVTALSVCAGIVWVQHGVAWPAAAGGAVLFVAACVLLARVCMALTALFLHERRSRELSGVFALVILVVVVPVGVFFASLEWGGVVPTQLTQAVKSLAITPLGAAVAFPGMIALGSPDAGLSLLIAVATIVGLGLIWFWLVHRAVSTIPRPTSGRQSGGLSWFAVAPGTPGGAIAARSLMYWLRDRRYIANVVIIPIAAALSVVPLLIVGVPVSVVALVPVPLVALFLGWLPHNDLAYDSTAVWIHIASGVRGASDRLGRLVPILLLGIPTLAIAIPIAVWQHGRWAILPAMVGVCASLFLTGLGLSSISSVVAPYPATRPGDSPFRQPQRTGSGSALAQAIVMLGAIALSAAPLWWGWLALTADIEAASTALWGGLAIGFGTLVVGVTIGSFVFERRGGRLMEFAEST